ncbi:MAG: M6 family metalloprotease domain-containing protein [Bacteroidaceae bacterium]|nr:M6 family metalloprotease domain-containing protein [Bacteroidaceae bacterium]
MRHVFLFLSALLLSLSIGAVPAKRQRTVLTLADGSRVTATSCGDENMHFFLTDDGRTFCLGAEGLAYEVERPRMQRLWRQRSRERSLQRRRSAVKSASGTKDAPFTGDRRGLVILVSFPDRELLYDSAEYHNYFNQPGYSRFGMTGSVHDYFLAQSYGQFSLTFDVVGPVTVSQPFSYYGENATGAGGTDLHPGRMITEAVLLADSLVNYADYDWDGDGYVEQVVLVYAGYSEAQSPGNPSLLWPHEWSLTAAGDYGDGGGSLFRDGVWVDTYACSSELRDSTGTALDGIGTACHEFSHCLGLPDLYDTDRTDGSGYGMSLWSVMDEGMYAGRDYCGTTPSGYTSYERMCCGWLRPEILTDPCIVTGMPALAQEPRAYILYNGGYKDEYYLLENRQRVGWDTWLPGHGMLVLHVDYDADAWNGNRVNADNLHPRLTVIPADNHYMSGAFPSFTELAGDPFPGTEGNTALTDSTRPAAMLYHPDYMGRKLMGKPVTDIAETDGLISFVFDGGTLVGTPVALEPDDITEDGFIARWTPVPDADYYQVMLLDQVYETEEVCYLFRNLECGGYYSYKVRAVLGDYLGEWSNVVDVDLSGTTCIKDVNAGVISERYDLQGRRVSRPARGIYILNGSKVTVSF